MADREHVRKAVYDELESAVPASGNRGHVPVDNISEDQPDKTEDMPAIVHSDTYRKYPINMASDAPTSVEYDNNGDAVAENHGSLHQAQFGLLFRFTDESEKEACYEAVRRHFEKFEESPNTWDPATIQQDIKWVRVLDSTSDDDDSADPTRRGDRVIVRFTFQRDHRYTDTAIQSVDHEVDADNDNTTEFTITSS